MKIKINSVLKNMKGKPLNATQPCCVIDKDGNFIKDENDTFAIKIVETPSEKQTLKDICMEVLMGMSPDEKVDGKEKYERFKLAMKIGEVKEQIDLKSDDVTKIKELIGKIYSPLIVGQCYDILENK